MDNFVPSFDHPSVRDNSNLASADQDDGAAPTATVHPFADLFQECDAVLRWAATVEGVSKQRLGHLRDCLMYLTSPDHVHERNPTSVTVEIGRERVVCSEPHAPDRLKTIVSRWLHEHALGAWRFYVHQIDDDDDSTAVLHHVAFERADDAMLFAQCWNGAVV